MQYETLQSSLSDARLQISVASARLEAVEQGIKDQEARGASDVERISPLALVRALALSALAVALLVFALGDRPGIAGDDVLPGLLMATGLVAVTRLSGLFPLAWSFLRAQATLYPTPTRRVSFRHQPLHVPLYSRVEEDR